MKLNHLGRYVKIIYPIEGTYSGYFSAKSTSRGTIRKQQQVIGRPDPNPGNVMSTRITDIDATPDINAIENDTGFRKRVVAKTPPTLANPDGNVSIYSLESYYQYLTMLNQDVSSAAETISVSIDGTDFAGLGGLMDPAHGLSSFSISLGADGVASDIVFADRPPKLPKRDVLLQQVGPRITDGKMGRGAQKNIAGGARYGFGT